VKETYALIVEHQADTAEVAARILKFHNRSYEIATSAEKALDVLEEVIPKIIIVHLSLPDVDGWELLRIFRNMPLIAKVPVVAITSQLSSKLAREAVEAGFNACFAKPLDTTSFVRELDRVIETGGSEFLE
jgi:CheY-like chemotaxis protein